MIRDYREGISNDRVPIKKQIKKLGTVKLSVVETTPIVWKGRLLRFEWVRNSNWGKAGGVSRRIGHYHFVDMETEEELKAFAPDHSFGCCYAENDKMFVCGVRGGGGGNVIDGFVSSDLEGWQEFVALTLPQEISTYNTSICRGENGYVMAIEIRGDHPYSEGCPTCIFAVSEDLVSWRLLDPAEHFYGRTRYVGCPCLRYYDGWYYIICLERAPFSRWLPYVARSRDLKEYEMGIVNPIMWFDDEDKRIVHPERFSDSEIDLIENAVNCNCSDHDMCDFGGKTVITYSWGNQHGKEFLALAEYDGSEKELLESFF